LKTARTCGVIAAVLSIGWAICMSADALANVLDTAISAAIL